MPMISTFKRVQFVFSDMWVWMNSFILLYSPLNYLCMNALLKLIHKINWPEKFTSSAGSHCLSLYVSLSSSSVLVQILSRKLSQMHTNISIHPRKPCCFSVSYKVAVSFG